MTSWETLQSAIQALYVQYVGSGSVIENSSGSPTVEALLMDLVHNRIVGYPYDWDFLKVTGTLTLTGASSYNLKTTFPDLKSVYQIYGIQENQDQQYLPNYEANIVPTDNGFTLKGNTLVFTGNTPSGGSATIQYKSLYMVKDSGGTRKQYFTSTSDESVLESSDMNVLLFGFGQYVNWKSDSKSKEQRDNVAVWFKEAWQNLLMENKNTSQVHSML